MPLRIKDPKQKAAQHSVIYSNLWFYLTVYGIILLINGAVSFGTANIHEWAILITLFYIATAVLTLFALYIVWALLRLSYWTAKSIIGLCVFLAFSVMGLLSLVCGWPVFVVLAGYL